MRFSRKQVQIEEEAIPEILKILKYILSDVEKLSKDDDYLIQFPVIYMLAYFREKRAYDSYFAYGDGRIFCVGTKGRAEIRTTGDRKTNGSPYGLWIRDSGDYKRWEEVPAPTTLTRDFLNRIEGKPGTLITNQEVLRTSRAAIQMDESMEKITMP